MVYVWAQTYAYCHQQFSFCVFPFFCVNLSSVTCNYFLLCVPVINVYCRNQNFVTRLRPAQKQNQKDVQKWNVFVGRKMMNLLILLCLSPILWRNFFLPSNCPNDCENVENETIFFESIVKGLNMSESKKWSIERFYYHCASAKLVLVTHYAKKKKISFSYEK